MLSDHPIDVILLAKDLPEAKAFYADKIGLEVLNEFEEASGGGVEFKCGGDSRLAMTASTTGSSDTNTKASFRVPDLAAEDRGATRARSEDRGLRHARAEDRGRNRRPRIRAGRMVRRPRRQRDRDHPRQDIGLRRGAELHVRVVLERLGHRAVRERRDLALGRRRLRERPRQGLDHEAVGLLGEGEAVALAARADDAARRAREGAQVVGLAAARAARQLGGEARRQRQLQPEGERRAGLARRRRGRRRAAPGSCRAGCRRARSARPRRTGAGPRRSPRPAAISAPPSDRSRP